MPTQETVADLLDESSGEAYIALATLIVDDGDPVYLAENNVDIVSRGNIYRAAYFKLDAPKRNGDELPAANITLSNVDRSLIEAIRTSEKIEIIRELVAESRPDVVEDGPYNFSLNEVQYDEALINGTLGFENILDEKFPELTYNPADTPAVFA
tara:strand:+ start:460 stop:921 length:462 start_codon:yes stop_codon:yes gene_type:complete